MENKKYCLKPGYVLREIAGEHLAIPVTAENSSDIVVLNPVSAVLWSELEAPRTIDELADKICESFDIISLIVYMIRTRFFRKNCEK